MITLSNLKSICENYSIILNIDFQISSLHDLLNLGVFGLTLKGGEEERVGVKSFDELDEIFDWLEENVRVE
jgi:phosphoribosylanthranilate isomerase